MNEVFVVTHDQRLHLIDGVFSSQQKAEDYIAADMAERNLHSSMVKINYYNICKCNVDRGDSCYVRHSTL